MSAQGDGARIKNWRIPEQLGVPDFSITAESVRSESAVRDESVSKNIGRAQNTGAQSYIGGSAPDWNVPFADKQTKKDEPHFASNENSGESNNGHSQQTEKPALDIGALLGLLGNNSELGPLLGMLNGGKPDIAQLMPLIMNMNKKKSETTPAADIGKTISLDDYRKI